MKWSQSGSGVMPFSQGAHSCTTPSLQGDVLNPTERRIHLLTLQPMGLLLLDQNLTELSEVWM